MWIHYPLETRTELRSSRVVISACTSPFRCQTRRVTTGIYKNMRPDDVMFWKVTWFQRLGECYAWLAGALSTTIGCQSSTALYDECVIFKPITSRRFCWKIEKETSRLSNAAGVNVTTNYPLTDTQQWLQLPSIVMDWLLKVLLIDVID